MRVKEMNCHILCYYYNYQDSQLQHCHENTDSATNGILTWGAQQNSIKYRLRLGMPCLALVLPHVWGSEVTDTDTKDLHTFLSLTRWTQSAMGIPVHCLISSVQRLRGLPRRLFLAMISCRICVHKLSARSTWPKYCNFLRLTSARKRHVSSIKLLVLCSVQLIRIILLYMSISKAFRLLLSAALIVQASQPYVATD